MPERMSKEEIEDLAKAIAEQKGDFYVAPEDHYNQHKQMKRILDTYEKTTNVVVKFFVGLFLVGIMTAIFWGFGFSPK